MVGVTGFEPTTPCTPCKYSTRLSYTPTTGIIYNINNQKTIFIYMPYTFYWNTCILLEYRHLRYYYLCPDSKLNQLNQKDKQCLIVIKSSVKIVATPWVKRKTKHATTQKNLPAITNSANRHRQKCRCLFLYIQQSCINIFCLHESEFYY